VINRKVGTCDIALVAIGPHWLRPIDASGKRRLDDEADWKERSAESNSRD